MLLLIILVGAFSLASMQPTQAQVSQEQQFLSLVNQERTSRGLAALTPQPVVTESLSRPWALKMAATGRMEHSGSGDQIFDAVARLFPTITGVGENVGYASTVDQLHRALMDSPVHRANLLSAKFGHIGLGVAEIGSTVWVTQTFFTLAGSAAAAAPAPAAPARAAVAPPAKPIAAPAKAPIAAPVKVPTKTSPKVVAAAQPPTAPVVSSPAALAAAPAPPPTPSAAAVQALSGPPSAAPSPAPPLDVAAAQLVRRPVNTAPTVAAGLLLALGLALHLRLSLLPNRSVSR
jgi:hypothetical protein